MPQTTNFKGSPLKLNGSEVAAGQEAPNFKARKSLLDDVSLSDYRGKTIVISVVPSLDTGVCDIQSRRFNEEAGKLGDSAVLITISRDLPPAQARWCGAADAKNMVMLSDYKDREFGEKYGCEIDPLGVLSRAVFVIGPDFKLKHVQYVGEVTEQPDYDAALAAAKA